MQIYRLATLLATRTMMNDIFFKAVRIFWSTRLCGLFCHNSAHPLFRLVSNFFWPEFLETKKFYIFYGRL
jgi:hypothetical protein